MLREPASAWRSMSRVMSSQMPVLNPPGSISTTCTPSRATSIRSASVSASSACLAPVYQPASGELTRPAIDDTLTMRPRPLARMTGSGEPGQAHRGEDHRLEQVAGLVVGDVLDGAGERVAGVVDQPEEVGPELGDDRRRTARRR